MTGTLFLFLAMFCQNPKHTIGKHNNCPLIHVSTLDDGSDDTGHVPPKPPVPPTNP